MTNSYSTILDHPKIAMPADEYDRIQKNKQLYMDQFPNVQYTDSNGTPCSRPFHSINVSKVLSRKLAKLVFNEGCVISVDNKTADKFLQEVFRDNKFRKNFGEELEAGYAIGGLALRPCFDPSTQKIKISFCRADSFFPLQSNSNDISEAAIANVDVVVEGNRSIYYTLLEIHEWVNGKYQISNELYRSETAGQLGNRVPLTYLDKYKNLQPMALLDRFTRPLFTYIKLAGKNNANLSSPLGAGVIDNSRKQLMDINEKYDQFMWEIEKSRTKILASDDFFKVRFDEKGQPLKRFETTTDIYQRLKSDDPFIDSFSPSLHSTEYIESINFILKIIETQVGLSPGTMSFDGQSVKTATEIISENSETFSTRADNVLIVEEAIKELVTSIFELARAYGVYRGPSDFGVNVDFDDGVFESKQAQLEYNNSAVTGQLMSKKKAMMKQFGYTEKEAEEELRQIFNELMEIEPSEFEENAVEKTIQDGIDVPGFVNAGDVEAPIAAAQAGTTVAQVSLNGAQITSLVNIVQNVAKGELPYESALAMIVSAFPFDEAKAREILGNAGKGFKIKEKE